MASYSVVSGNTVIQKDLSYSQAMVLWDELDMRGFENVEVVADYCYATKPRYGAKEYVPRYKNTNNK